MFLCKQNICNFYKAGLWVVFIKTRTQYASKDGIELAVFVAFGEVLSFGLGVVELILIPLLTVLLVSRLSFVHTMIYDANKQAHNQDIEIKVLSLSSNREHIKYGVRSNVFMWSPNFMTGTRLRKAW